MTSLSLLSIFAVSSLYFQLAQAQSGLLNGLQPLPSILEEAPLEILRAISQVENAVLEQGCDTNLCFALQGGNNVTDEEYRHQVNFADLILQIVTTGNPANYAAVQYASGPFTISPLTSNRDLFLQKLQSSRRRRGGTNIVSGIKFCARQLKPRRGDANKMIVIGNQFATVRRNPRRAARQFLRRGGAICAVAVGEADINALKDLTGDPGRIVNIGQFFELGEIIVQVVQDVCELRGRAAGPTIL